MSPDQLSADVRSFLAANIDSVEQLELLLLLHQSPEIEWTPASATATIYGHIDSVRERLRQLERQGLLARTGSGDLRYRYVPVDDHHRSTVDQVAATYKERRVAVITFIASLPLARVRAFSDAFRLRRDDD